MSAEWILRVDGVRTAVRALATMTGNKANFADALLAETARPRGEGVVSSNEALRKPGIAWREPADPGRLKVARERRAAPTRSGLARE